MQPNPPACYPYPGPIYVAETETRSLDSDYDSIDLEKKDAAMVTVIETAGIEVGGKKW
jgi:hypothetical protein